MRYSLQKYTNPASRERCPNCNKPREYVRYVDTKTGELLPTEYGKCNRADKCGYSLSPYHKNGMGESYASAMWKSEINSMDFLAPKIHYKPQKQKENMKIYIDSTISEKSLKTAYFAKNSFALFVFSLCKTQDQKERAIKVMEAYKVGTCTEGCIFWFCDQKENYHAGQVKEFDLETGKTTKTTWIHTVLHKQDSGASWLQRYYDQDEKVGCLFGEHLLTIDNKDKVIVLVESPKNAILCEIFTPRKDAIYLATYSLSAFTPARCESIIGRKIQLLPDLGRATEVWKQTAPKFLPMGSYVFIDYLEKVATDTDRAEGKDVADFIIATIKSKKVIPHEEYISSLQLVNGLLIYNGYPAVWDIESPYVEKETKAYLQGVWAQF